MNESTETRLVREGNVARLLDGLDVQDSDGRARNRTEVGLAG